MFYILECGSRDGASETALGKRRGYRNVVCVQV